MHCHRERGGGVGVVSIGTCKVDLWLAVQAGGIWAQTVQAEMVHHLFRIGVSILSQMSWSTVSVNCYAMRQGRHCDNLKTRGPGADQSNCGVPIRHGFLRAPGHDQWLT